MLEYSVVFRRTGSVRSATTLVDRLLDEIFVVPVCSIFTTTPGAYLDFLRRSGALDRATAVVAGANLRRTRSAELTRREVRAIFTAAEVDSVSRLRAQDE